MIPASVTLIIFRCVAILSSFCNSRHPASPSTSLSKREGAVLQIFNEHYHFHIIFIYVIIISRELQFNFCLQVSWTYSPPLGELEGAVNTTGASVNSFN